MIGASNSEYGSRSITNDANLDEKRLHKCHMHALQPLTHVMQTAALGQTLVEAHAAESKLCGRRFPECVEIPDEAPTLPTWASTSRDSQILQSDILAGMSGLWAAIQQKRAAKDVPVHLCRPPGMEMVPFCAIMV